jgi:hypothetical protein
MARIELGPRSGVEDPCRACATFESDEQWRSLPLVRSMESVDLVPHITTHWTGRAIEVRRCVQCGRSIARVVPPRAPFAARRG